MSALTVDERVDALRAALAEVDPTIGVYAGTDFEGTPCPVFSYDFSDHSQALLAYRAGWLLGGPVGSVGKKRRCFDCFARGIRRTECDHEPMWV